MRQRQRFFTVGFYRGAILLFAIWVTEQFPESHSSMAWPILVFGGLYTVTLFLLGLYIKKWRYFQILLASTLIIDTLTWGLLLIQFSSNLSTNAPALLPALSFEGLLYWDVLGGVVGLGAAELLLLNMWVYQKTVRHVAFSPAELSFWMIIVALVACLPIYHLWSERLLTGTKKEKAIGTNYMDFTVSSESPNTSDEIDRDSVTSVVSALTKREQEIYRLLKEGLALTEIASHCHIEYNTVKTHVRNICVKFNVTSRHQLP
jgi:DNA-binding CsgD family transcriptional regulator